MEVHEEAIRTHGCLLDHVVGIGAIPQYPSRQIGGAIQVWQHQLLKTNSVLRV
jgi:hypothetical protein